MTRTRIVQGASGMSGKAEFPNWWYSSYNNSLSHAFVVYSFMCLFYFTIQRIFKNQSSYKHFKSGYLWVVEELAILIFPFFL